MSQTSRFDPVPAAIVLIVAFAAAAVLAFAGMISVNFVTGLKVLVGLVATSATAGLILWLGLSRAVLLAVVSLCLVLSFFPAITYWAGQTPEAQFRFGLEETVVWASWYMRLLYCAFAGGVGWVIGRFMDQR